MTNNTFVLTSKVVNQYSLKSINTGGISPIEVVPSNRVILSPMPQNSKPEKTKKISVVPLKDEKLDGKRKFDTEHSGEQKPQDVKKKWYKREAKSACELRRNPRCAIERFVQSKLHVIIFLYLKKWFK